MLFRSLLTLEASFTTAESESPELMQSLEVFNGKWRERIRKVLEKWARLEPADVLINEWRTQPSLSQELEQQLDKVNDDVDGQDLRNIYAVLGSIQSLLEAMKELGDSMKQINWDQWAVERF